MLKRILSALIAMLIAATAVSCSDAESKNDDSQKNTAASSDASNTESESETRAAYLDDIPDDLRFDGENITFIESSSEKVFIDQDEDDMGDPVNDALWRRNNLIAERLNVNITLPKKTATNATLVQEALISVNAGTNDYDVAIGHARFCMNLATENGLYLLDNMNYLDLEKDYWFEGVNDNMALRGDHFWAAGDLSIHNYSSTDIFIVNARMWQEHHGDEDIYQIVRDGKWTLDRFVSSIEDTYRDVNSNGKRDKDDDIYGYSMDERAKLTNMFMELGVQYTAYDGDGTPSIILNNELTINIFEDMHDLLVNNPHVFNGGANSDNGYGDLFPEGRAMIQIGQFSTLEDTRVRAMEDDFYVVPVPKYSEEQPNYIASQQDGASIYGMISTIPEERQDVVAATLEAMCSLGKQYVIPVYYDKVLKSKYSRDPETAEMIDLIRGSLKTDFTVKWADYIAGSYFAVLSGNIHKDSISSVLQRGDKVFNKGLATHIYELEAAAAAQK